MSNQKNNIEDTKKEHLNLLDFFDLLNKLDWEQKEDLNVLNSIEKYD